MAKHSEAVDQDEDYMSPTERAEALALFRPFKYSGKPLDEIYREGYARGEPKTLYDRPRKRSPTTLTTSQIAFLAVAIIGGSALAGWLWRKHREKTRKQSGHAFSNLKRSPDLLGLDVVLSSL